MDPVANNLLRLWLEAGDGAEDRDALDRLITEHIQPVVRRIVSLRLGRSSLEFEDVCQTALKSFINKLTVLRAAGPAGTMRDVCGYAAVIAFHAADGYVRNQHPAWNRIAGRLRHVLSHEPDLDVWSVDGKDVCGMTSVRGSAPGTIAAVDTAIQKAISSRTSADDDFAGAVRALLRATGCPVPVTTAVNMLAKHFDLQMRTRVHEPDDEDGESWEMLADEKTAIDVQTDQALLLQKLWKEICALPVDQRRALLLNLEGAEGGDIRLFEWLGVASIRDIAKVIEMPAESFAALWNDLPLDDQRIAAMYGMNRQRVINLRSSARKRLINRIGGL